MKKIVLITGATAGIGEACALRFAREGYDLIITGRRMQRLTELQKKLSEDFSCEVHILCFDVQSKEDVDKSIGSLPEKWKKIDILINNAGLALGRDNFADADMEDWETMLQTNVNGLL